MERAPELANIKVVGVGGGGTNAVNRMKLEGMQGADLIAVNTDAQALDHTDADYVLQIGDELTRGLGAGADPKVGYNAAEESRDEIADILKGADMVFVTAGEGGGTGTGAAPVVAEIARSQNALTVGVVTRPFTFEGPQRRRAAEEGIAHLSENVDTLIVVPNDRLMELANPQTTLAQAFEMADNVLLEGVSGIVDVIAVPGMINLDFADVRTIMSRAGDALMGIGAANGENRALEAAKKAANSPLLERTISGSHGVLMVIAGGEELSLFEVNEAAEYVTSNAAPDAHVIFGTVVDQTLGDHVKVTVVAAGFNADDEVGGMSKDEVAKRLDASGPRRSAQPRQSARRVSQPRQVTQPSRVAQEPVAEEAPQGYVDAPTQTQPVPAPARAEEPAPQIIDEYEEGDDAEDRRGFVERNDRNRRLRLGTR